MTEHKDNWETPARRAYWDSLKGTKGSNAPHWKGNKIGKTAVHCWLNVVYGKPKKCEHCGTTDESKVYEWANKDHKYRRVREDFKRLCRSCHRKYDLTPDKKEKAIKNLYWNTKTIRTTQDGKQYNETQFVAGEI